MVHQDIIQNLRHPTEEERKLVAEIFPLIQHKRDMQALCDGNYQVESGLVEKCQLAEFRGLYGTQNAYIVRGIIGKGKKIKIKASFDTRLAKDTRWNKKVLCVVVNKRVYVITKDSDGEILLGWAVRITDKLTKKLF